VTPASAIRVHSHRCRRVSHHAFRVTSPRQAWGNLYAGLVVVLVSAMTHGLKPERVQRLREALGVDRRTLDRRRQWWLRLFVNSAFWQEARARFMPPVDHRTMPLSLCLGFEVRARERLVELLRFLAPMTTPTAWGALVM
jgi:hypothetical protein